MVQRGCCIHPKVSHWQLTSRNTRKTLRASSWRDRLLFFDVKRFDTKLKSEHLTTSIPD
jgi:hypothetical protein